jgi:ankyrin repeat protein
MNEPLFLGDWFPPDPPLDDDDDWFDRIEDPYPLKDPDSESELFQAAIVANDLENVKALLEKGISPNSYDELVPLLSIASSRGGVEIIRALLEAGASPNLQDDERYTPLMFAAQAGHLAIVQDLMDAGANVQAVNKDGNNALSMAAGAGQIEMVEYLLPLDRLKEK